MDIWYRGIDFYLEDFGKEFSVRGTVNNTSNAPLEDPMRVNDDW
jgi:hypothetical protein